MSLKVLVNLCLKLALHSKLIPEISENIFLRSFEFYEDICVQFERKNPHNNIGYPTFELTASIKTSLVYDYSNIGSSLVVYIVHKGIISEVLWGYEVQVTMYYCFWPEVHL